jgi:response regulator RpfG family c-di-GMP phosphodiesterase
MNATSLKVLVIDDKPPIRKLLRMGLGTQGYHTIDAANDELPSTLCQTTQTWSSSISSSQIFRVTSC